MYPADRMLRDRMLGSMIVSSASGALRMRPGIQTDAYVLCILPTEIATFTLKLQDWRKDTRTHLQPAHEPLSN